MTVPMIKSIGDVPYPIDTQSDAFSPLLTAGAALGITGNDAEESAWLARTSEADGVASVRSIHGNTIVQDGELVSVQMEGIESTGFNVWDEKWEVGDISGTGPTGGQVVAGNYLISKNYIPVFPSTDYCISSTNEQGTDSRRFVAYFYDENKAYIDYVTLQQLVSTFTTPANCHYIKFRNNVASTTYNNDICINLSDPTRNGTYEPYWQQQRSIPAGTLRSAGSVYDEQTATERITRIGERAYQSGDESDATVVTDGTVTHYPLATPTTTPIDPPLNLTYRTAQGGTERVMVPTGELSAPPTIVAAQGYTAESLRDAALSAIAPVENGLASTNYGVGSYLVHGGQLCKVTVAIATGEAITIGTNVTATTVMAEILSLVQ